MLGVILSSVAWGVLVAQPGLFNLSGGFPVAFYGLQVVLLFSWYALIHRLLRGPYEQSMPEVVKRLLRLFWAVVLGASGLVAWLASQEDMPWQGTLFSVSAASIALVCLALAAQLGRDAPIESRTALRSLVAAAGLATGAQAALAIVAAAGAGVPQRATRRHRRRARRLRAPAALRLRLRPQWSLAIFVSPEARSYAPRFLATLSILLLALLLLPVFRSMAPELAQQSALLLVVATGVPMGLMLFSERLNARLRVYVSKHFLPFRYDYREEWLRLIDTLVSPDSQVTATGACDPRRGPDRRQPGWRALDAGGRRRARSRPRPAGTPGRCPTSAFSRTIPRWSSCSSASGRSTRRSWRGAPNSTAGCAGRSGWSPFRRDC